MNAESQKMKCLCLAALGKFKESMELIIPESEIQSWSPEFLREVLVSLLVFMVYWSTIYFRAGKIKGAYNLMFHVVGPPNPFWSLRPSNARRLPCHGSYRQRRGKLTEAE